MFSCRMCDKWEICTDEHKSGRVSKDGDSWAYWCDDFYSKEPVYNYETDRYIATQSPYNYHTMIVDKAEDKIVFHSQTSKPLSRQKLKEELEFYFMLLEEGKNERK